MTTWIEAVEERAKTFDLAAKLNASVNSDTAACEWHANALRKMARIIDEDIETRRKARQRTLWERARFWMMWALFYG